MRSIIALKIVLIFILICPCYEVMSQLKFVSVEDFECALEKNPNLNALSKEFDLIFILLLDPSFKRQFFEYDKELEELYNGYSPGLKLSKSTVGFATQITDIKEIFDSDILIKKVYSCIFTAATNETERKISYPIYIKDNTAIIEIFTSFTSDIFYFRLEKGIVQINWLGGTIE